MLIIHAFPAITRLNQRARTTNITPTNTSVMRLMVVMFIPHGRGKRKKWGSLEGVRVVEIIFYGEPQVNVINHLFFSSCLEGKHHKYINVTFLYTG